MSAQGVDANVYDCCRSTICPVNIPEMYAKCLDEKGTCKYTYMKIPLCPKLYFLGVFKKQKKTEFKGQTVGTLLKEFGFAVNMMVNPFMPCFVWTH